MSALSEAIVRASVCLSPLRIVGVCFQKVGLSWSLLGGETA